MNFSVDKQGDASVWVLLEADTPHIKGLYLYPLPLVEVSMAVALANELRIVGKSPHITPDRTGMSYTAIINMTRYSDTVARALMSGMFGGPRRPFVLTCNRMHANFMRDVLMAGGYFDHVPVISVYYLSMTAAIKQIFEDFDPLKTAKSVSTHAGHIDAWIDV